MITREPKRNEKKKTLNEHWNIEIPQFDNSKRIIFFHFEFGLFKTITTLLFFSKNKETYKKEKKT